MAVSEGSGGTLEMTHRGRTERVIELHGADLHIGRHPRVGVALDHPKVSLYHARIERRFDGSYRVVDLMSKNATLVDGVKIKPFEPVPIREGTSIRIVDYEFIFHEPTARIGGPGEPSRSTVLGSRDGLSSGLFLQRSTQPAEALRAVLEVVRAWGAGRTSTTDWRGPSTACCGSSRSRIAGSWRRPSPTARSPCARSATSRGRPLPRY